MLFQSRISYFFNKISLFLRPTRRSPPVLFTPAPPLALPPAPIAGKTDEVLLFYRPPTSVFAPDSPPMVDRPLLLNRLELRALYEFTPLEPLPIFFLPLADP
jgi:hypothetical protein